MELLQSCSKPLIWQQYMHYIDRSKLQQRCSGLKALGIYCCMVDSSLSDHPMKSLFSTKTLSEPMLAYCWLDGYEQNLMKFSLKNTNFHFKNTFENIICKNVGHSVQPQCHNCMLAGVTSFSKQYVYHYIWTWSFIKKWKFNVASTLIFITFLECDLLTNTKFWSCFHCLFLPLPALAGNIQGIYSTNERQRYNVTLSFIGWDHTQNDPWLVGNKY